MNKPHSSDINEIAAIVSKEIQCSIFPSYTRVSRILDDGNGNTIEVTTSIVSCEPTGCDINWFWPTDCSLSDERKRSLFWQYHRSKGCNQYTAALAAVLKGLCDSGVQLTHCGHVVDDILVLNSTEFDVSDILTAQRKSNSVLKVHDPVTNTTIPCIATHEGMDHLHDLGEEVCTRLGMKAPKVGHGERKLKDTLKTHRPGK